MFDSDVYLAKVETSSGTGVMYGPVHEINNKYYILRQLDGVVRWYPVIGEIYEELRNDIYYDKIFLGDIVGFCTQDGKRRIGIVDTDDEGIYIREIVEIVTISKGDAFDYEFRYGTDRYFFDSDGVRRLCSSLDYENHTISVDQFWSGSSIETDQIVPLNKLEEE